MQLALRGVEASPKVMRKDVTNCGCSNEKKKDLSAKLESNLIFMGYHILLSTVATKTVYVLALNAKFLWSFVSIKQDLCVVFRLD